MPGAWIIREWIARRRHRERCLRWAVINGTEAAVVQLRPEWRDEARRRIRQHTGKHEIPMGPLASPEWFEAFIGRTKRAETY